MALKVHFDKNASLVEQMAIAARAEADIISMMQYAGEKFVADARLMTKDAGGFGDITGNLRSSIGYFIVKGGKIIQSNLEGTNTGQLAAKTVLIEVQSQKLMLVGVAGMDYASAVESRGYNVISVQSDAAIIDLTSYFKIIESKYGRA